MVVCAEPRQTVGQLQSSGSEAAQTQVQSAKKFKPLSDNCQRRSGEKQMQHRGVATHQQEAHYRTLVTCHYDSKKRSLNIHFEVCLIRQTQACVSSSAGLGGGQIEEQ